MKKNESLTLKIVSIYLILLIISFLLYVSIINFNIEPTLSTNLLIWSATIFAPIAVLMTYSSWKEQKSAEILSSYSDEVCKGFIAYFKILEKYSLCIPKRGDESEITKKLENHYEKIYSTLVLYCQFLRSLNENEQVEEFVKLERAHYKLLIVMETLNEEDDLDDWCKYSSEFSKQLKETSDIINEVMKKLVETILHRN